LFRERQANGDLPRGPANCSTEISVAGVRGDGPGNISHAIEQVTGASAIILVIAAWLVELDLDDPQMVIFF
jgi:hypothetical protein